MTFSVRPGISNCSVTPSVPDWLVSGSCRVEKTLATVYNCSWKLQTGVRNFCSLLCFFHRLSYNLVLSSFFSFFLITFVFYQPYVITTCSLDYVLTQLSNNVELSTLFFSFLFFNNYPFSLCVCKNVIITTLCDQ